MPALIDMLRPYSDLILPIFFIGFFFVTFTSVYLYKNDRIRTSYITGFLILLLVMNTVAPVSVLPFINWHKFSDPRAAEQTTYEVRIVDANGRELRYDPKATLKSEGVYMPPLPTKMANEYSDEKNKEIMRYLLMRGREYRSELENQSQIVSPAQFPAHGRTDIWTKEQLNKYSEFVGIRLYQVDIRTSDDGTEVVAYSERRLLEYHDSSENITVTETRREEGS